MDDDRRKQIRAEKIDRNERIATAKRFLMMYGIDADMQDAKASFTGEIPFSSAELEGARASLERDEEIGHKLKTKDGRMHNKKNSV